jgi:signal transduction histidine kinase/CheY-like chemotaxis protein
VIGALVGRDTQIDQLRRAVLDPDIGAVVVRGPSGAGKTRLVQAAAAATPGLLFGAGRYAEGGAVAGMAPVLRALAQIVEHALDLLYEPRAGAESLRAAMGVGMAVLVRAGFSDDRDLAASPPEDTGQATSGPAAIIEAILRLVRWLSGFGAPVVLFIDDWHRAPPQAQAFAHVMSRQRERGLFTLVLATRSQDVSVDRLGAETIVLGPLTGEDRSQLLGEAFGDRNAGALIAEWLGDRAPTLPFDVIETARAMAECGALVRSAGGWIVDPSRASGVERADVAKALVRRSLTVGSGGRRLALASTAFPEGLDPELAARGLDMELAEVHACWASLRSDGIMQDGAGKLAFVHDRMRAATLEGCSGAELATLSATMAERLVSADLDSDASAAVLNLRLAGGLEDPAAAHWRDRFASASTQARLGADMAAAGRFAEAAWTLRALTPPADPMLDRRILREATLAAAGRADRATVRARAEDLVAGAVNPDAWAESYELAIHASRLAGDADAALAWAVSGLRRFGIVLPRRVGLLQMLLSVAAWQAAGVVGRIRRWLGPGRRLPGLARLANVTASTVFDNHSALAFLVALKASARARIAGDSSHVWRSGDVFICSALTDYRQAARLAARDLESADEIPSLKAATLYRRIYFGHIWTHPAIGLRPHCAEIYDLALAEGDLVVAGFALRNDIVLGWRTGVQLNLLARQIVEAEARAERLGHLALLASISAMGRLVRRLAGDPDDGPLEAGLMTHVPAWAVNDTLASIRVPELEAASLAGRWGRVLEISAELRDRNISLDSHPGGLAWRFHESLARLKLGLRPRRGALPFIARASRLNPQDHAGRVLVLKAETMRARPNVAACLSAYARAVEATVAASSQLEAIIATRCAAEAAEAFGDIEASRRYRVRCAELAAAWGWRGEGAPASPPEPLSPDAVRRALEAETAAAMAERSDRAKARLLADVAHELRTPLQGLQGMIDLAAMGAEVLDPVQLRDVLSSLRVVVDDLADLGAHASGGAPLNLRPVDLALLVRSEAAVVNATASAGREVRFDGQSGDAGEVLTDGPRVRQVLRNLLSNAVKYGQRGAVTIRLQQHRDASRARVVIEVDDCGPGLRDADLLRLFEPFDRGGRDDGQGLGLGLALARRIAERLGGTLIASNRAEGGARFSLRFEVDYAAEAAPAPPPGPTTPRRILLVEDVDLSRRVIAEMLRAQGHAVVEARDGSAAISQARLHPLDLILLDLGLPDRDGIDVLSILCGVAPSTPVVVLTASTSAERAQSALDAGAVRVFLKPISAEELGREIGAVLGPDAITRRQAPQSDEFDILSAAALAEVLKRGAAILDRPAGDIPIAEDLHYLAGLAGQFGAEAVAAAADRVEQALATPNGVLLDPLAALGEALRRLRREISTS